jgi:energy-coupling factor transporter ATP-binding protein EcfA2
VNGTPADAAADAVVRRTLAAAPTLGTRRLVCVDGPAGSGKSTLARDIRRAMPADVSCRVVHLDDLYPGWDGLRAGVEHVATWVVGPIAAGKRGRYHRWDWHASAPGPWVGVPVVDVLVLEGVGSGSLLYAHAITTLVWVEADPVVRLERCVARDGEDSRTELLAWTAAEAPYLLEQGTRERADLVVRT